MVKVPKAKLQAAPSPETHTAQRRPTLRSGMKRKLSFELTPKAHDFLRYAAFHAGTTQINLLELMIKRYLDPESKYYDTTIY